MKREAMLRKAAVCALGMLLAAALPVSARSAAPPAPPAVGTVKVGRQPIRRADTFVGRIEATDRVRLMARVTAFLDQRFFTEGSEVKKGELLYRLEQAPFQADVQA